MLVTPLDLGYMVPVETDPKDLSEEHCKKIDEYFDSMMLGGGLAGNYFPPGIDYSYQ